MKKTQTATVKKDGSFTEKMVAAGIEALYLPIPDGAYEAAGRIGVDVMRVINVYTAMIAAADDMDD